MKTLTKLCPQWLYTGIRGYIAVLASPKPRHFSVSAHSKQANLSHPLIWAVDWARINMGEYACVDPHDPTHLTYLSEKEYHKLSNVIATQEKRLIVIAHPFDAEPSAKDILAKKPSQTSPPKTSRTFWSGLRSWMSGSFSAFLDKGRTMFNPAHMSEHMLCSILIRVIGLSAYFSGVKGLQSKTVIFQSITSHLKRTYKSQGVKGLVLLLKTTMIYVMKYLGRIPTDSWELGHPISLRKGLPAWLPLPIRASIRAKSLAQIRFIISLLYVYKVFRVSYNITKAISTIISTPLTLTPPVKQLLSEYELFLRDHWIPNLFPQGSLNLRKRKTDIKLSDHFFTPCAAGPNGSVAINNLAEDCQAWIDVINNGTGATLFAALITVANMVGLSIDFAWIEEVAKLAPPAPDKAKTKGGYNLGNVCLLGEPAGKTRPVALVDLLTQRVLRPLHDDLMHFLKRLPWDGTANQNKLWDKIKTEFRKGKGTWSSIDISSATDTIPVHVYIILLTQLYTTLFGGESSARKFARAVITLMTDRDFLVTCDTLVSKDLKDHPNTPRSVRYTRGQPMGCLGSFALLGLWNNSWVAFAAWKATGDMQCIYGVTGDDVVIKDKASSTPIAKTYIENCKILDIPISIPKTFQSNSIISFLSRWCIPSGEISPISWKEELSIIDGDMRTERALKLRDREYWSSTACGWLSQAVKFYLTPSEYLLHIASVRKGTLSGYGFRALMSYLVPSTTKFALLGLQGVPVLQWLSACAGSVTLLSHDIKGPSSIKEDTTVILSSRYSSEILMENIRSLFDENVRLWAQYAEWYKGQHISLRTNPLGELFLPRPFLIKSYMSTCKNDFYQRLHNHTWEVPAEELPGSLLDMLEGMDICRNFLDIDLFINASASLRRGNKRKGVALSKAEGLMFALMWNITIASGGQLSFRIPAPLQAAVDSRMERLYGLPSRLS